MKSPRFKIAHGRCVESLGQGGGKKKLAKRQSHGGGAMDGWHSIPVGVRMTNQQEGGGERGWG